MKITDRDVEILRFVNECGFCITPHLEKRFKIKNWRVYQLMKRLVDAGYMKQVRVFHGKPNIYYVTNEGAVFSDLPVIERISTGIYEHQVALTDVVIKLCDLYPAAVWTSERQLRHDKFFEGLGVRGHIADGLMTFEDDYQIAIEVELTLKSQRRLDSILRAYMGQVVIKEVWYFCSQAVIPTLTRLSEKRPIIKIHSLKEFII